MKNNKSKANSIKLKKTNSKADEPLQEVVFACNSSTNLCECHGMEIAIGTLSNKNLEEIASLVEEGIYLDSDYFSNWYHFDNIYHENGVFLDGSDVENLEDKNGLSTSNFEIGDVKFNDITLDKKSTYLCTFRNEAIYNVSKGMFKESSKKKVDCEVSTFGFLEKLADVSVSILKSSSINGDLMYRDTAIEEDSGEIYDTNQFLIKNCKIVFYTSNGIGQYPFCLDESLPLLNSETDKRTLKKIISSINIQKDSSRSSQNK